MIAAKLLTRLVAQHPVPASLLRISPPRLAQKACIAAPRQFRRSLIALLHANRTPALSAAFPSCARPTRFAAGKLPLRPAAAACGQMAHSSLSNGQLAAAGPTLTSEFLLRHDAANARRDTVVVVLNWDLPMCTPRLMSAGDCNGLASLLFEPAAACGIASGHVRGDGETCTSGDFVPAAARMCICADGGANQLYDELPQRLPAAEPDALRLQFAPHAITGWALRSAERQTPCMLLRWLLGGCQLCVRNFSHMLSSHIA